MSTTVGALVNPGDIPIDPRDPQDERFSRAVRDRFQYATMDAVERVGDRVARVEATAEQTRVLVVQMQKSQTNMEERHGEIMQVLQGTTKVGAAPTPGLIRDVAAIVSAKRWALGLLGVVASASVGQFALAVLARMHWFPVPK